MTKPQKRSEGNNAKKDGVLWAAVFVLLIAGVVLNIYFSDVAWGLRAAAWIALVCVVAFVAYGTEKGKAIAGFAKDARGELRKVTWPTRPETVQTTLVVAGMVSVTALVLWGVDTLLLWAIGWLTGQRG